MPLERCSLRGDKLKSRLHLALRIWDLLFKVFSFLRSPVFYMEFSWRHQLGKIVGFIIHWENQTLYVSEK